MLLSAAIIVKNEEGIIKRCLDCVSQFADEIVVVDTGSTDKTKEIASRHPKVKLFDSDHFGSWTHYSEFSFSVAKNEAVKKCEGDWVCVPAGHLVSTGNGVVPIEKVKEGMLALSHKGRLKKVTGVGVRSYDGELVCLRARGNGDVLRLTPEHRVWAIRSYRCHLKKGTTCLPCCKKQYKRLASGTVTRNCKQPYGDYVPEWIAAGELTEKDIVLFPRMFDGTDDAEAIRWLQPSNKKRKFKIEIKDIDYDLGRLVGFYLAEGCIDDSRSCVDFSFHLDEVEYHDFVTSQCLKLGVGNVDVIERPEQNSKVVRVASASLCDLMSKFGRGSHNKKLPLWAVSVFNELFLTGVFHGWMQGDGGERKDGVQGKSMSAGITYGMKALLTKIGVVSSYSGYKSGDGRAYNFTVGGDALDNEVVSQLPCGFRHHRSKSYQLTALTDDFLMMPLTRVWREDFCGEVYNLEVADDSSYVCSGMAVHNCWWDADDFVDEENAAKIRKLAEETTEPCLFGFSVKYGPLTFEHCRMFKNGVGIFFDEDHSVHEYLNTIGYPNVPKRDIEILHIPGKKSVPSGERNIAIMEKDYYERGMDDPRTCFYLANGYREAKRHGDAVEFFKKYLEVSQWGEERFFARYFMSQTLVVLGRYGEARQEALRAIAEDYRFAEAYCLLGDLALKEDDFKRAQSWYMLATDTPLPKDAKLFVTPVLYNEYPSARIRECHEALATGKLPKKKHGPVMKILDDVQEVMGTFRLPEDEDEAIVAGGVMAAVAEEAGKVFEIVKGTPAAEALAKCSNSLIPVEGNGAVSLILPPNLNGRSREEWYGRAVGHVSSNWGPIIAEAQRVSDKVRRTLNAN